VDAEKRVVKVRMANGTVIEEPFSILVVCTGVQNSFWRPNSIETLETRNDTLQRNHDRVANASSVAVLGGGAAGVSACWSMKEKYPDKEVHYFFSGDQCLPSYHANTRVSVMCRLETLGVILYPRHRAVVPEGCSGLTQERVNFTADSPTSFFDAELVLWALGPQGPNTDFLPPGWLSPGGFVKVDTRLRVVGHTNIFAVGDCADSDPDRCSARNYGWKVLAKNIVLWCEGVNDGAQLHVFKPSPLRWGSVYLSAVDSRMLLASPGGSLSTLPGWFFRNFIMRFIVFKTMLRGSPRRPSPLSSNAG
jgi:NADH dehydrogenase FAD-containing subunit